MGISIDLVDSLPVIRNRIHKAISEELNKRGSKKATQVKYKLKGVVGSWIMEQPEIQSLLSQGVPHTLNAEFGLVPGMGDAAVSSIVSAVASSIQVKFSKIKANLTGGIEFSFQSRTFSNLLGLSDGHVIADLGGDLHWLDWLLTKGDAVIVVGYFYKPSSKGRSGGGTMKEGGMFRVDPFYSGTTENNFITRALLGTRHAGLSKAREVQLSTILSSLLR